MEATWFMWERVQHTHLRLEGAVERREEVRARGERQDPPLHQGALRVLVLEENVFLQHLHGEQTLAASLLRQQHLSAGKQTEGEKQSGDKHLARVL